MSHEQVPHPSELTRREAANKLAAINNWAALKLAACYGAAVTIWLFMLYSLLGAIFSREQVELLYWSSGAQLVFCPLMVYVGNVLGKDAKAKADADHQALTHIATTVDEIKEKVSCPDTH